MRKFVTAALVLAGLDWARLGGTLYWGGISPGELGSAPVS